MSELISDWRNYLETEKGRAPQTIKLYTNCLETLHREFGDPAGLSTDDLRSWLHAKSGQASTVSNRISALKSFYQYLVRSGARKDDPSLNLVSPKRRHTPRQPLENLDEVLSALDDEDRKANRVGTVQRRIGESRDMAVFLAETGLRISEAVNCKWPVPCPPDVDVSRGRKKTSVHVTNRAREAWDRLGGRWPVGARATQRRFERAAIHPQRLRHLHRANRPSDGQDSRETQGSSSQRQVKTLQALKEVSAEFGDADLNLVLEFLTKVVNVRNGSQSGGGGVS